MTLKVGFIGLGIMGKPMSKNLIKAGYSLVVLDRNSDAVAEVIAAGAETATTAKAIAEQCDVIITMLPNSPHVKEVALGENGIIDGAKPGLVVIDMSSIAPLASREISEALKVKGVEMLDAPVSGGEPKAIDGTLSVMVGGDKAVFDKYYDLMKAMAGSVVHTGEIGAGNVTKLANQVIVALNIAAMSEALTLATKAGVNPDLVYQAIRGGLAGSTVLDAKAPMVMDRNFKPGFRIDLHIKDLANALDTSHGVGAQLPLTAAVMEMMQALRADGLGTADHSALACYYEKLANQVIVALNIAAMSEALTLATKAGVNPDLVYQAIRGGLAGSTVLDAKAPMVMDRNFKPGFRIDLHIKDLANALDTSHGVGAQLPLTAAVMEMMQALRADGLGNADHSAIACYYEKLAKVEVTR